uniref:Uncharacterized protein n=1 Tax=Cannabis sativa TaxID=3483 RepID=A0A803PGB2_CANSA
MYPKVSIISTQSSTPLPPAPATLAGQRTPSTPWKKASPAVMGLRVAAGVVIVVEDEDEDDEDDDDMHEKSGRDGKSSGAWEGHLWWRKKYLSGDELVGVVVDRWRMSGFESQACKYVRGLGMEVDSWLAGVFDGCEDAAECEKGAGTLMF